MPFILSGLLTLDQHLSTYLETPSAYRPQCCPHCGSAGLWCHGTYDRQAKCEKGDECPVPIQRFFCPPCRRTCSVLPEYIPPRRWYHWALQSVALSLLLMGKSVLGVWQILFDQTSQEPSLSTLRRWWSCLREGYALHRFHLCSVLPELGRAANFTDFWQTCLQKIPLSSAMNTLHRAGVRIP